MDAQGRVHRITDTLDQKYDGDHDIGVEFNWVDAELLEICKAQQVQLEELAVRIWMLEHPSG